MQDTVDSLLAQWFSQQPELDSSGLGIVVRIQLLSKLMQQSTEKVLAPLELKLWEYDVLSALRRQGAPFMMPASELARAALLTSGAMTTRIDRLAGRGLVRREAHRRDRRGVNVQLTDAGHRLIDAAFSARLGSADELLAALSGRERNQLSAGLRKMLVALDPAA